MKHSAKHLVSDNVIRNFSNKQVLRGFSFRAESSRVTFLAGENGAGKTTWMRIATGLLPPTQGVVLYDDLKIAAARQSFAVVFDEPPVYANLSGLDNLRVLSGLSKFNEQWKTRIFQALKLEPDFLKQRAGRYSLGQRHRLAVAAALLRQPLYLMLDEPTIGLDPSSWELVSGCLRQMADEGAVIIVTGQDFHLMEELVDEIIVLHNGRAIFTGNIVEFISRCPVTVCVRGNTLEKIQHVFPGSSEVKDNKGNRLDIRCNSVTEAEGVVLDLQKLGMPLHEVTIQKAGLGEAFVNIIREEGGVST